jgi:hypothetical protein
MLALIHVHIEIFNKLELLIFETSVFLYFSKARLLYERELDFFCALVVLTQCRRSDVQVVFKF